MDERILAVTGNNRFPNQKCIGGTVISILTKPVNVSLTMAHNRLLEEHLPHELDRGDDEAYTGMIQDYLNTYREEYGFDSVFLVSAATRRYYNFNGIDRVLTEDNPENGWYFELMAKDLEYKTIRIYVLNISPCRPARNDSRIDIQPDFRQDSKIKKENLGRYCPETGNII